MKILVTGGVGFIGSNFIHFLLTTYENDTVICLDKLTYAGNIDNLKDVNKDKRFFFEKGDISDFEKVKEIFIKYCPDIVVNFAAESHVDRSIKDPMVFIKTNILGTFCLLEMCKKYGIKRYHQVSTDEVYGELPLDDKKLLFTEKTLINTSSPYSASKAGADLLVQSYYKTFGVPISITRCSNNYGPFHFPEKLIPLMITRAIENKELPLYGNGENVRDWLYVQDHCSAIDLVMRKSRVGEIYNIGGNSEKTNIEVVNLIIKQLGKKRELIKYVEDRLGHDKRYAIDATKVREELGWSPKVKFEEGIEKTIDWYLKNTEWWEKLSNEPIAVEQ